MRNEKRGTLPGTIDVEQTQNRARDSMLGISRTARLFSTKLAFSIGTYRPGRSFLILVLLSTRRINSRSGSKNALCIMHSAIFKNRLCFTNVRPFVYCEFGMPGGSSQMDNNVGRFSKQGE